MAVEDDEQFVRRVANETAATRRSVQRAYEKSESNRKKTAERVYAKPCHYGAGPLECTCPQHAGWRAENGY